MIYMAAIGVYINCILMVLNLIPIPPLDGGRILTSYLPGSLAYKFSLIEPYGLIVLVVLLVTEVIAKILLPAIAIVLSPFSSFAGIDISRLVYILFS